MRRVLVGLISSFVLCVSSVSAQQETPLLTAEAFAGLELRNLGPALMSGRIADIVKDPTDPSVWYVGVASGGVWKTTNAATTWTPIFDDYATYSVGSLALDPRNPQVVWVGTGENNSQRSVGWGDGIYKSRDGGETFERMGLQRSEHIGKIVVDPGDSNVVWVAAQGPLWSPGGDRGLYKTIDGGETWDLELEISENTGVSDVILDPRDPETVYAASYQRRRHQCCLVAGGPESAIYKSTDGGISWRQLTRGLPASDRGRIGLAISPQNPDVLYATIPAVGDEGGFFRSANRGESWEKTNDYVPVDPQYYQEIFPDPHLFDRVYVMDVWIHVSDDGGKSFRPLNSRHKHVDNHALVFDPLDPEYLMVGCDGGIYESWDRGETWRYIDNLPVTQFYRVGVDNSQPFYFVYGGTQDNDTQGGPSRTTHSHGIRNSDWFITVGGDGYQTRIDPDDPNILYSMWQYGGLVRYDRASGERVDIQPQPGPDEAPLKWHWDSPLMISPHAGKRLYFAANRLFRSDDRGDSWQAVSPDLTRQLDRNQMEIMGRIWSVDAVWKNVFTSFFGHIVALDESPLVEGLLYAGTDDGLVQVSSDGGQQWRRESSFPGVPEMTYVADLTASHHAPDTVYAAFNNHKQGDFKPYLLKSVDRGATWTSIAGDLPPGHVVWTLVEDHLQPDLLFVGTELGLFFTRDGGGHWIQLKGNVPTIAVRDLEIQRRESDLIAATFGRGFLVFDDYSPLREADAGILAREGWLFPVKDAWMYQQSSPLGWGEKAVQGDGFFTAPNPPFGAIFTYHLAESLEDRTQARRRQEKELRELEEPITYPTWEELRLEDREVAPRVVLEVRDVDNRVVRRISAPESAGFHRVAWDLRYPAADPVSQPPEPDPWGPPPSGPMAMPGTYNVRLTKVVDGEETPLGEPRSFQTVALGLATLGAQDREGLSAFQLQVGLLQRAVMGTAELARERGRQLELAASAVEHATGKQAPSLKAIRTLQLRLADFETVLWGDRTIARRSEPTLPGLVARVDRVVEGFWSTSAPTQTHRGEYATASTLFADLMKGFEQFEVDFAHLQQELELNGAPWTPGRGLPDWRPE
jgi:photosystem II stability/assembly factor-like uncharacterized protein